MDPFTEELTQVDPTLKNEACTVFRESLLAIVQHLEREPSCQAWSLDTWGTWLEDGGFDRERFGAILRRLCQAILAESEAAELLHQSQTLATAEEGIPILVEIVTRNHPALAEQMERLEALAPNGTMELEAHGGAVMHGGSTSTNPC